MKFLFLFSLLFLFSCRSIDEHNNNRTNTIIKNNLKKDCHRIIGSHKTKAIFDLYDFFNQFLDSTYSNYPKEKRIRLYIQDYNKSYISRSSKIDFSGFKIYMKNIHESGVFDEFVLLLDERYFVSNEIFMFYDSIYYKKHKKHYILPKDSIFNHSEGFHSSNPMDSGSSYNWFNKIYYCLHSSNTNKDLMFNKIMNERFYGTPFNVIFLLSNKKDLNLNKIHYKFLILFETLLPIYDYKNNEFVFGKDLY